MSPLLPSISQAFRSAKIPNRLGENVPSPESPHRVIAHQTRPYYAMAYRYDWNTDIHTGCKDITDSLRPVFFFYFISCLLWWLQVNLQNSNVWPRESERELMNIHQVGWCSLATLMGLARSLRRDCVETTPNGPLRCITSSTWRRWIFWLLSFHLLGPKGEAAVWGCARDGVAQREDMEHTIGLEISSN